MGAMEVCDAADRFASLGIEDVDASASGEVEAVGRWVGEQAIPTAVAADLPAVEDFVGLLGGKQGRGGEKAAQQGRGCEGAGENLKSTLGGHGGSV